MSVSGSQTYNKFQQIIPPSVTSTGSSSTTTTRATITITHTGTTIRHPVPKQDQPSGTLLHKSNSPAGVTFLPFPFASTLVCLFVGGSGPFA